MVYTSSIKTSPVVEEKFDILGNAPSTAAIPQFNTTLEAAIYIGSVCEEGYTNLMTSIGINELAVYESTGAEILYEAEDGTDTAEGTNMKDKALKWIKDTWEKIKKVFEEIVKKFMDKVKEAKSKKMDKLTAAWNKKKSSISDDKNFGTIRYLVSDKESLDGVALAIINSAKIAKNKYTEGTAPLDAIKNNIVGAKSFWSNINSVKDFKPVFTEMIGVPKEAKKLTKADIDSNLGKYTLIAVNGADIKGIKKMYSDFKSLMNDTAKDIKNAKGDDFKAKAKFVRDLVPVVSAGCFACVDIMKARYAEAMNVCIRVATALSLTKGEKKDKEAAPADKEEVTESAVISAIETAFDW